MGAHEISGDELDAYLACPDCPVCGSDDVTLTQSYPDGLGNIINVTLTQSYPDGLGNIINVYLCNKCGHVWSEATPA